MPNWTTNIVTLRGSLPEVAAIAARLRGNAWAPYTEDTFMRGEQAGHVREILERPFTWIFDFERLVPLDDETLKSPYDPVGYDWQRRHWGTKWNSAHVLRQKAKVFKNGKAELRYRFDSAWCAPRAALTALSLLAPGLSIGIRYKDEDSRDWGMIDQAVPDEAHAPERMAELFPDWRTDGAWRRRERKGLTEAVITLLDPSHPSDVAFAGIVRAAPELLVGGHRPIERPDMFGWRAVAGRLIEKDDWNVKTSYRHFGPYATEAKARRVGEHLVEVISRGQAADILPPELAPHADDVVRSHADYVRIVGNRGLLTAHEHLAALAFLKSQDVAA